MNETDTASLAPWIQYAQPVPGVRLVLLCIPHAGGSASSFRDWTTKLASRGIEVWPVQLPGRETRYNEPLLTDLGGMVKALSDVVLPQLRDRPYAVFGHSAGSVMAYAFARHAVAHGQPPPRHLFVSACRPPQHPDPDFPIHLLPDDRLLDRLVGYGRMPMEVLRYPDLTKSMINTARADLQLVETYPWPDDPALDCPVTALGGLEDVDVPVHLLPDWRVISRRRTESHTVPGGHFPEAAGQQRILEVVRRALSEY
ncbi:thioesterase domain-containing protein [Micromonospora sp. NPDC049044]|uniref:thioesterase II family protein n=1 Tax=unclassified Micromonospora TaxID=2617518 RepID=UPI003411DB78